ncbi:MAG TPA: TonB-dependent receptor [bacterium]
MAATMAVVLILISGTTGKIQGTVIDRETGEPISYANVMISNTERGVATDDNGLFYILNVPSGIYTVEVSCLGYQSKLVENVVVEVDQTARLKIELKQTIIELAPVTVTGQMPSVKKDMVATTYVVRKEEIYNLPFDYTQELISFQPAVAHFDTAMHVRGGRATEVQYMIDNVSIIDPQTGDAAIMLSKGIVDEVIFLPGGFDVEYGRAMSGVINIITARPANRLKLKAFGKTETIMPYYYDFGYQNYQTSAHVPVSKMAKGFVALDLMHTDDWDPKLFIIPHKRRDDYSVYGKGIFTPANQLKVSLSAARSRSQFDRYNLWYRFNLDHYRSDVRTGDIEIVNANFLPDSRKLFNLTVSRLYTQRTYGVREPGSYGYFEDYEFKPYEELQYPSASYKNPFGMRYVDFKDVGDYPEYQEKTSVVYKGLFSATMQLHKYNELRAGMEYTYQTLDNFTYFVSSDTTNPITDEYTYKPEEYAFYIQDNVDYEGLYAKIGCRVDHFGNGFNTDSLEPKNIISPRLGISFLVTEKFLFRANVGRYAQPPLYDQMYRCFNLVPAPSYIDISPVGNPDLSPEKTISVEIGMQGEVKPNVLATVNTFYKDVSDLIGTRFVYALPSGYVRYLNVEYANVKGIEAICDFSNSVFSGKVSYTLSWARGTSSYAEEAFRRYYEGTGDTSTAIPATEYFLDFDQRNRVFIQGGVRLPWNMQAVIFGYFGDGFPFTPVGPEGKLKERNIEHLQFQREIDCAFNKIFRIGNISAILNFEIINLLDARYEIADHYAAIPLEDIEPWEFTDDISITNPYYGPGADINHDGVSSAYEQYVSFKELITATDDWVNSNSAPRRARLGISINL